MRALVLVLLNAVVSASMALAVVMLVERPLPETIRCRRLEASESVDAPQIVTGYAWIGIPDACGRQGSVTINAGRTWAGINVTDGERTESLWVEGGRNAADLKAAVTKAEIAAELKWHSEWTDRLEAAVGTGRPFNPLQD